MITTKYAMTNLPPKSSWLGETYIKSCPQCAAETETLTTLGAAEWLNVPIYDVYRKAEAGELHSIVTAHGLLLICRNSLV